MTTTTALQRAVDLSSITKLAAACDVTPGALRKWLTKNGLPMSDLTGETEYSTRIAWEIQKYGGEFDALDLIRDRLPDMKPGTVYRLPLELFTRDPNQPRKQFDTIKLEALALTLGHDGQETPIKVTVDMCADIDAEKPLIITHGERRWRAAHIAQLTHLDCMLDTKAADERPTDKIFRQAADNTGEQLSKWDWACTIRELSEQHGMTDSDISTELGLRGFDGFSRPVVANLRRLFKLPEEAQRLIECGWLTPSHGKYLLAIKHQPVLEGVIRTLTAEHNLDNSPPTIYSMDVDVRDYYAVLYPTPDGGWDNPETGEDHWPLSDAQQEECKRCEHLYTHTLGNGHQDQFCTNPECYIEKDHELNSKARGGWIGDDEDEDKELLTTPASPPMAPERIDSAPLGPTPASGPEAPEADYHDRVNEERERLIDRTTRMRQAVMNSDRDTHLAILCMSAFCEDNPPMTIQQAVDRMAIRPDELIQAAAYNVLNYLDPARLADIRQHLNVPDVSPETDRHDLLETA